MYTQVIWLVAKFFTNLFNSYKQLSTGQCKIGRYGGKEKAIVDKVTFIEGSEKLSAFNVVLRVNRFQLLGLIL